MAMLSNESSINAGLTPTLHRSDQCQRRLLSLDCGVADDLDDQHAGTTWSSVRPRVEQHHRTGAEQQRPHDVPASANYYLDNGMYIEDTYRKYGGNGRAQAAGPKPAHEGQRQHHQQQASTTTAGLAYWRNPIFPVYDDNGDYWLYGAQDYSHPLALTNLQKNDSKGLDIISFASVNWDVLPCLNVMAQFNYKHGEQITDKYFPKKYSETGVFNDGYGSIDNWKDDNIVSEAYATFDRTFC